MRDEMDEAVDRAIEAEKLRALQHYRLHPIRLRPTATEQSPVRSRAGWMLPGRHRLAWAGVALVGLSLFAVLRYEKQRPAAGITSQTVELALSAANRAPQEPAFAGGSSSGVHEAGPDMAGFDRRLKQLAATDAVGRVLSGLQR